jgi:hypothetical protein
VTPDLGVSLGGLSCFMGRKGLNMSERERGIEQMLKTAGVTPNLVGIGRDDEVAWAKFRVGTTYKTLMAKSAESDEEAAADIFRQARELGIGTEPYAG